MSYKNVGSAAEHWNAMSKKHKVWELEYAGVVPEEHLVKADFLYLPHLVRKAVTKRYISLWKHKEKGRL